MQTVMHPFTQVECSLAEGLRPVSIDRISVEGEHDSRSEQAPESEFHLRGQSEQNYNGFQNILFAIKM